MKVCGFCAQGFHCLDVVITSCKHTFHPFCLIEVLWITTSAPMGKLCILIGGEALAMVLWMMR
jgi:hypothetical protein